MAKDQPLGVGGEAAVSSLPAHFGRNFAAFLADYVFFCVAFSLVSQTAVMPAFVRTLTDSEPVIGLVSTIFSAGWLLPQLGVAAAIGGKPFKKPYMIAATYTGRLLFFPLAFAIWLGLTDQPSTMLMTFFLCIGVFSVLDSIASVVWFDLLARAIPQTRRGRLIGTGQLLSSLLGVGTGVLVARILQSPSLGYPANYAVLFGLSALVHIPGMVGLAMIREPEDGAGEPSRSLPDFARQLGGVWRGDPNFRRLMSYRWLVGLMNLALPFYVLHAMEVVGLPEAATGQFVSAQMAGGIFASLALGWMSERKGPLAVSRCIALATLLSPLLALALQYFHSGWLSSLYLLVFCLIGIVNSSWMLGPTNYLLEMAPDGRRPLYVGLYNTMAGVLIPASFLGGVILRATSYVVLFGLAAAGAAAGLWISLSLGKDDTP